MHKYAAQQSTDMFWFPIRHRDYVGHSLLTGVDVDAYNYDNHTISDINIRNHA